MPQNTIRFPDPPDPLYERIKDAAARDRRSVHAEMLILLKEALDARDAAAGQPERTIDA